ncbi:MAG TPA: hypothetical protein VGE47_06675, partial [Burkholderiaceae bacterium]
MPRLRLEDFAVLNKGLVALLLCLVAAAVTSLRFPVYALPLTVLLVVCAGLVWRRPVLALAIVPMALPVLDLAPWSGRFFWDEFDLLCLVCLSVAGWRAAPAPARRADTLTMAFVLFGLSLGLSTVIAL